MQGKSVMANPGRRVLTGTELGIVVGSSQEAVTAAMQVAYSMPPPLEEASAIAEEAKTRFEVKLLVAKMCSIRCMYTWAVHMCIETKSAPYGILLMRIQVLYWAAQVFLCICIYTVAHLTHFKTLG